jgi:membrane associated rhomboid family serine protease
MRQGLGLVAAIILVVTLAASLAALFVFRGLVDRWAFRPYWVTRRGDWQTLITSGLVHADLSHLIFNGVSFWFFAVPLEGIIGSVSFAVLYLLGLLLSLTGSWVKHRNDPEYATLGASGAISAAVFALIVYAPTLTLFILPIPFPIPAPLYAIGYLIYSWWSSRQNRGRINHDAHLGGALTGLAFVAVTDPGAYGRAWVQVFG